jgi:hypothetical protein
VTQTPDFDALRKQYELVLQEYRFQVQLNWDRSKHYLTFNTTLLGAAVALSKNADTLPARAGLFGLLVVAAMNSYAGMQATSIGHRYYQRTRSTKSELEKVLGLGTYSIQSTPGMRRDHDSVALGTPEAKAERFGSIVQQTRALLGVLCAFSTIGAVGAFAATMRTALLD